MFIIVFINREGIGYGFGIFEIKFLNGVLVWGYRGVVLGFFIFVGGIFGGKYIFVINLNSLNFNNLEVFKNILFVEFRK